MKNSKSRRRLNSVFYILITTVVVVGMPVVLVGIAGWPLPTKVPNFSNVSTAIQQQNIPAEVIIKALAVVLWLVWIQLVWSLIWEIIYVGPKLSKGLQAKSAPMSSSPMQHLAARLVGGIMSVGLITTSFASTSALPTEFVPTLSVAPGDVESDAIDEPVQVEAVVSAKVWRVMPGDSLWSISQGNESVMNAIFEANPGVNTALDVEPGMDLVVPDKLDVPADRLVEHLAETNITVEKGDHLWGIAEERLEQSLPTDPSNAQIVDYVSEVVEANPSVASNPDLIYPDDHYTFPEIGTAVPVTTPSTGNGAASEQVSVENANSSTVSGTALEREIVENDQGIIGSVGSLLVSPRGVILGAGLFGLFLSLQQRQLVQGATKPLRRRGDGHPDDLMKACKLPLVEWAGKELSKLVSELKKQAAGDPANYPRLLEVRLGDGIEVIWQTPQLKNVKPWEISDDGRRWKLPYRANAKVVRGQVPAAFGALVTLGSRTLMSEPVEQGRLRKQIEAESYSQSVLVNLTDYGTMSIVGSSEHTMSAARSLVLELGSSENVANAKVLLIGLAIDGVEHMHRVKEGTEQEALALLRSAAVTQESSNGQEAVVVVVDSESPHVQTLLAASPAGSSTAVVVVGAAENTRRHFVVQPSGSEAFFLDNQADIIEPVAVTAEQASEIAKTLEEVAGDPVVDWHIELDDGTAQAKAASIVLQLGSTPKPGGISTVPTTLVVLGEPSIPGIDSNHAALAAVSLVLSSPTRSMKDTEVIETVWGSGTITTEEFWGEIEDLRTKLSSDAISRSSSNELIVSAAVRTDLEIFASYVSQSVGLPNQDELILLLEALKLVDGVPFTGSPLCHWAYRPATPLALQAIDLIEATALRAAQLGIDNEDYISADRAISEGLSGTGPNEPLMRMQMRIEAAKGNIDGVEAVFSDFSTTLSGSAWKKPVALSAETTDLHSQLVSAKQ